MHSFFNRQNIFVLAVSAFVIVFAVRQFFGADASRQTFDDSIRPAFPAPQYRAPNTLDPVWLMTATAMAQDAIQHPQSHLLFVGDTLTDYWRNTGKNVWQDSFLNLTPVNLGIENDRTENILYRLTKMEFIPKNLAPKMIVLSAGAYNLEADESPDIVAGQIRILAQLRALYPNAEILVMALFHRADQPDLNIKVDQCNQLLAKAIVMNNDPCIKMSDINTQLETNGQLRPDCFMNGFLLSEKGYQIWAHEIMQRYNAISKGKK